MAFAVATCPKCGERFRLSGRSASEDFGLWMLNENSKEVWGRPVGLLVLKDGSLLIADDGANKIWRVSYRPPK